MATSFNRKLKSLEETINSTKFNSVENVFKTSPDEIRKNLRKLIRFVEDGVFAKSETELFICKNFREKPDSLLHIWNKKYKNKSKTATTLRVQIHDLSKKFYCIFGENFDEFYYNGNVEMMQRFCDICDALRIEKTIDLSSAFIDEVYTLTGEVNRNNYDIDSCKDEFILLRRLMKTNIKKNFESVDMDKLYYIINNLNKPIIGADQQHLNFVKVWLLSHLYSLQKSDTTQEVIPLKYKGKEHLFENKIIDENDNIETEDINEDIENIEFLSEEQTEQISQEVAEINVMDGVDKSFFADDEISAGEVLDAGEFDFSFDQELASGTSLYMLIDQFWDYVYNDEIQDIKDLDEVTKKQEIIRIKKFFSLFTPKGLLNYLKEKKFNKTIFEKMLVAYTNAIEENDKK